MFKPSLISIALRFTFGVTRVFVGNVSCAWLISLLEVMIVDCYPVNVVEEVE
jgi:hypothetical protein